MNSSRLRGDLDAQGSTQPVRLPPGRDRLPTRPSAHRIAPELEDDRDRRARRLGREAATSAPPGATITVIGVAIDQVLRRRRQLTVAPLGPAQAFDRDIAALDIAGFGEAFAEGLEAAGTGPRRVP